MPVGDLICLDSDGDETLSGKDPVLAGIVHSVTTERIASIAGAAGEVTDEITSETRENDKNNSGNDYEGDSSQNDNTDEKEEEPNNDEEDPDIDKDKTDGESYDNDTETAKQVLLQEMTSIRPEDMETE